jgi:multiple sugar transport system permease protein
MAPTRPIRLSSDARSSGGGKTSASHRRRRSAETYLLLAPALGVLVFFFFGPALFNVVLSFEKISLFELGRGGSWVGLANFRELLRSPLTGLALTNTVFWLTLVTVVLRLGLGIGLALLLNAPVLRRWHLMGIARSLVLIPWVTPPVVAVAGWQWLLQARYGAINQLLVGLGLLDQGVPFLVRAGTVWWSIVAIIVWRELPFVVIALLAGLQSIPEELYEAGRIDGASPWELLRHLTLPLLRPVTAVVTLLITIWTFNNFLYVWLTTRGGPGESTQVLATQMFTEAFVNYRLGYGAAVGVLMSVIMLLFALIYFNTTFKGSMNQT